MPGHMHVCMHWNRTNGDVINGGVSQTNAETCKISRICVKFAGFAQKMRNSCANLRNITKLFLQNLRKCARNLQPRLSRYRLLLSEAAGVRAARPAGTRASGGLQQLHQLPHRPGAHDGGLARSPGAPGPDLCFVLNCVFHCKSVLFWNYSF